jgi:hypothetical protein
MPSSARASSGHADLAGYDHRLGMVAAGLSATGSSRASSPKPVQSFGLTNPAADVSVQLEGLLVAGGSG